MKSIKQDEFQEICKPVIKWMNENCHPHCSIEITQVTAELKEGVIAFTTEEFIKD